MKLGKKLLFVLLIICLNITSITTYAADEHLGTCVDGSILTEDNIVTGSTRSMSRGVYLGTGNARLTNNGGGVVNVWGDTSCYKTCDQVKVTLHLQRLVKGTWTTVTTLDTKVAYNTNYVSNSRNVTVTGGYYYRISGTHVAVKGKTTESTYSSTDGMWVSK